MNLKEATRKLWETCFDDSKEFTDLYFSRRYTDEVNHFIELDGQVISALQTLPYPMSSGSSLIRTAYVSGVCTHPDYRERGLMKTLMQQTHQALYREGVVLATLIPAEEWLKGYYARFGYGISFFYQQRSEVINKYTQPVNNLENHLIIREIDQLKSWNKSLFRFFEQENLRRNAYLQHTYEDSQDILADHLLSGGKLYVAYAGEEIRGMAWGILHEGQLTLKDFSLGEGVEKDQLFTALAIHCEANEINYMLPGKAPEAQPLGMARVIHAEKALSLFAQEGILTVPGIQISEDKDIPENNGYYCLEKGRYIRVGEKAPSGEEVPCFQLSELIPGLFNRMHPYMSLMLN